MSTLTEIEVDAERYAHTDRCRERINRVWIEQVVPGLGEMVCPLTYPRKMYTSMSQPMCQIADVDLTARVAIDVSEIKKGMTDEQIAGMMRERFKFVLTELHEQIGKYLES